MVISRLSIHVNDMMTRYVAVCGVGRTQIRGVVRHDILGTIAGGDNGTRERLSFTVEMFHDATMHHGVRCRSNANSRRGATWRLSQHGIDRMTRHHVI